MTTVMMLLTTLFFLLGATSFAGDRHAFTIGGMEVIALSDAVTGTDKPNHPELLVGLGKADAAKYLVPGAMANSINCFLVKMNGKTILFDTGLGTEGVNRGTLLESLKAADVAPEDIDVVVISHFHPDHVGGLTRDGAPVFTKSRLLVPRLEVEKNAKGASRSLAAYAGGLLAFEWDQEIFPGITALDASGHTPGHTAFLLESGGKQLLIVADAIHFANIQLPLPDVAVTYDSDPEKAIAARKMLFDKAVREGLPLAGMHLAFPGVGTLAKDGTGYDFTGM